MNPFKKKDRGISFLWIMGLFLLTQIAFVSFIIRPSFFDDHRAQLIEIGKENNFKYDPATELWTPEPTGSWTLLN